MSKPKRPKKEKIVSAEIDILERWPANPKPDWKYQLGTKVKIGQRANGDWYLTVCRLARRRYMNYNYQQGQYSPEEYTHQTGKTTLKLSSVDDLDALGDGLMMLKEWMTAGKPLCKIVEERKAT